MSSMTRSQVTIATSDDTKASNAYKGAKIDTNLVDNLNKHDSNACVQKYYQNICVERNK